MPVYMTMEAMAGALHGTTALFDWLDEDDKLGEFPDYLSPENLLRYASNGQPYQNRVIISGSSNTDDYQYTMGYMVYVEPVY